MNIPAHPVRRRQQQGIATILIILLTGLSLSAAMFGVVYRIGSAQEQSIALHAQTQAQIKAWTGAEIVRRYFATLQQNEAQANGDLTLSEFAANISEDGDEITIDGVNGIAATVSDVDAGTQQIVVDITGTSGAGTRAEASSTLQAVYEWSGGGGGGGGGGGSGGGGDKRVITFNRNLKLGGSIEVISEPGSKYTINVKGDVTTGGNRITGVNVINATGSIEIGSGSSFDTLRANGDVKLTGSVSGEQNIEAKGNVCLSGGASAQGTVHANGTVVGDGSVQYGDILSRGQSTSMQTALCGTIATDNDGHPYGVDLKGNSGARSVTTTGSVRVNSGSIGAVQAAGDLRDTNWGGAEYGQIGGVISGSNPAISEWIKVVPGLQVDVAPVEDVVIESERFDAYDLEASANYAFKMIDGYKRVYVRNISGIADGDYFLFNGSSGPYKDYLCPLAQRAADSTADKPACKLLPAGLTTICKGYSAYNTCFSYGNGTWTIAGESMAQGVAWFEGNLTVSNGTYFNTFIATGNITTGGSLNLYAPNFAGYSGEVDGEVYARDDDDRTSGICDNTNFPALAPTQFCQDDTYLYSASNGLGNYALMAGSCSNEACTTYVGGNIALGASNNIRGSIKAGNEFSSGGSTTVTGYISALAQGTYTQNSMGGSTTIRLTRLPPGYDPGGGGGDDNDDDNEEGTLPHLRIRWSRYL